MRARAAAVIALMVLAAGCTSGGSGPSEPPSGPTVSISDASASEPVGVTVPQPATFVVRLSQTVDRPVTFTWRTRGVTAISDRDYGAEPGRTDTISSAQRTATLQVIILADTIHDGNETFEVVLSQLTNAAFTDSVAIGTITEDAAAPGNAGLSTEPDKPIRETI